MRLSALPGHPGPDKGFERFSDPPGPDNAFERFTVPSGA